jgi:rod shape-determining protein MreD
MKQLKVIIVFFACVTLQVQIAWLFPLIRTIPLHLLLIALVYFCLDYDWFKGLLVGVLAGALLDILSGGKLGAYALSYGIIGMFVGMIQPMIFKEEFLPRLFLIFIGTLTLQILNYQVIRLHQPDLLFMQTFFKSVLPGALFNCAIATPFLFMIQNRLKRSKSWNRDRRRA